MRSKAPLGNVFRWTPPLALAVLLCTTPLAAQGSSLVRLSLNEAIALAVEHNPTFQQQRSGLDLARSAVRSAYGSLAPSASAGIGLGYTAPGELRYESQGLGSRPEYYSSDYSLRLSYQVNGSTLLQPGVERSRARATERRLFGIESQLAADVTRQYLAALHARERLIQANGEIVRTAEHVRLAEARLHVGAGTPLDLTRAEVQHGQAEVRLVQAENLAAVEMVRLSQLIGFEIPMDIELESSFDLFEPNWSVEELIEVGRASNPSLLAARATADAAETSRRAARSQYLPTLSLSAGVVGSVYQAGSLGPLVNDRLNQLQGAYGTCLSQNEMRATLGMAALTCLDPADPGVQSRVRSEIAEQNSGFPFGYARQPLQASIGLSLPLLTGYGRQHQNEVARIAASDARHQVRAEELRLHQEVTTAVLNLHAAYRTALLQDRVREGADEELRLATERFRFGAATSIEITDAQANLARAEIDKIEAVFDFHQSLAALETLVGETLREQ
jgi:outer membrane protein